jgi:rare lipoprotein A (peptidoglycan hydrolase)
LSRSPALILLALAAALLGAAAPAGAQSPAPAEGGLPADVAAPALGVAPGTVLGRTLRLGGRVTGGDAGAAVEIQRLDHGERWIRVAQAQAAADGSFSARWRADAVGRLTLRAVVAGAGGVQVASAPATVQVTVYRPARATWYGPGLFGRRTACGQRLTRSLVGVAHKRLPCGTPVEVFYGGRTITAPVVDRGPFAHRASYDLTAAAARQLGFEQTGTIGVSPRRGASATPATPTPAAPAQPSGSPTGGVGPQPG